MSELTTERNHPGLNRPDHTGMNAAYLILPDEERAKGYVRPVRDTYKHVGEQPKHPLRDLTTEEKERYKEEGYVKFEIYPRGDSAATGRFWTQAGLDNRGCGTITSMSMPLAETWARDPKFYGATFCSRCIGHFPVAEFIWKDSDEVLGSEK